MAAISFDAAAAAAALSSNNNANDTSFVFDIYDDGHSGAGVGGATSSLTNALPPALPGGPCNFVDLTHGSSGPQCGCRRFWSRTSVAGTPVAGSFGLNASNSNTNNIAGFDESQANWCMCSHHACFHDQAPPPPTPGGVPAEQQASPFLTTAGATIGANTVLQGGTAPPLPATLLGQENERPRSNRAPLSPVQDPGAYHALSVDDMDEGNLESANIFNLSFDFPAGIPADLDSSFTNFIVGTADDDGNPVAAAAAPVGPSTISAAPAPLSTATSVIGPVTDGSIPDTLSWGHYETPTKDVPVSLPPSVAPSQGGTGLLPPSQQAPSTTSSTSLRYLRPFAGRGLHTLKHAASSSSLLKSLPPPPEHDVATVTTPDDVADTANETQDTSPRTNTSSIGLSSPQRAADRHEAYESLSSAMQAHEMRLEKLENPSFSFLPGHEECQEKQDHLDMRVTEIESRMEEVEKRLNNNDEASTVGSGSISFTRRRLVGHDDDATTASVVSMATDATTSIASRVSAAAEAAAAAASLSSTDRTEIFSQLQALQAQVSLLQSAALPSYSSPWQLEVVFLPFPLKGVWVEASQFPTTMAVTAAAAAQRRQSGSGGDNRNNDDEWTQMPNTLSRQTPDPQSPGMWAAGADWPDSSAAAASYFDAPRLLPRACAPGRVIDSRLKSRSLVKTLSVRGADARSLQVAMANAFGHVFRAMASSPLRPTATQRPSPSTHTTSGTTVEALQAQFLGLQQPWVPLRKVHKDSRLRFLTRAEMLTPTTWDAAFLTSSVVMKASGLHRLYVTHPDAYLQDRHAYKCGWSWQRLRELGRVSEGPTPSSLGSSRASGSRASSVDVDAADPSWAWDSRLDEPPSASSPALSSHYQPSSSPFSRGTTPVNSTRPTRSHSATHPRTAVASTGPVPVSSSRTSSGLASGSTQQFFTVAQSPMQPTIPTASATLRRSLSPFFSTLPSNARPSSSSSARPPPLRTTSMPAPPAHEHRPSPRMMALSSPTGAVAVDKRHVQSAGRHMPSSSSSHHHHYHRHHSMAAREHRSSPSMTRPSPRTGTLPSPTVATHANNSNRRSHTTAAAPSVVAAGGVHKRRRSTRSPSVFWPRNTPRRSMSRSPSIAPAPSIAAWAADQPARGTTPFCYATPYSNAPVAEPPVSSSARQSSRRLGSRGPVSAVETYGDATGYYADHDMLGYDSADDYDYPMTQEDDDDGHDNEPVIEVYEDEVDDTHGTGRDGGNDANSPLGQQQHSQLLPEDEPWPGIEDDNDNEGGHSRSQNPDYDNGQYHGLRQDHDEDMSDSENMDPLSFEDDMEETSMNGVEDNHHEADTSQRTDGSSQPSEYPSTRPAWEMLSGAAGVPVASGNPEHRMKSRQDYSALSYHGRRPIEGDRASDDEDDDSGIGFRIHEDGDVDA